MDHPQDAMYFIIDGRISIGIKFSHDNFKGCYINEISYDLGKQKNELLKSYTDYRSKKIQLLEKNIYNDF